ncbi:glycosyltransferase family 2 protein [Reichenbachiella agarivorans]|uniref:Glycosyltransferase family 2 protein n=1 Tax=Reichenbachiella agarivorans TaxID=2979464 RepID=A0ABY6CQ60_9BACT|nr:glycosyltransferase family A protein [Reichenbachiella agarivorans]UXP32656.1 glycosyltransferase family 2 protein [Reichenbachiella agarivorans]
MSNVKPLVSVIIAAYNAEKYIESAIESILNQTYTNTEIIVVDDGSTDQTASLVKQYPVTYYFQKNQGQPTALNFGISQSHGSFLAFNDADDLWSTDKLELQLEAFYSCADLEVSFGLVQQFISPELTKEQAARVHCPKDPMNGYSKQTMLIKKAAFNNIGSFNPSVRMGDFIEWFAMAKRNGVKYTMVDKVVAHRRLHLENMSIQQRDQRNNFAQILKRHLDAQKK